MKDLVKFSVQFEGNHTGNFFSTEDVRTLSINNHLEYPVTFGVVKEFKKALSKELLKVMKNPSMHDMITAYGYASDYSVVNILRFTYSKYDGQVHVDVRPYDGDGYGIQQMKSFDTVVEAKNYMVTMFESLVFDYFHVKENSQNYFTKDMK